MRELVNSISGECQVFPNRDGVKQELAEQEQQIPHFPEFDDYAHLIASGGGSSNDAENSSSYVNDFQYPDVMEASHHHQYNAASALDVNTVPNQIFSDAERMAQLEREFHEQVNRLSSARPDLDVNLMGVENHSLFFATGYPREMTPPLADTSHSSSSTSSHSGRASNASFDNHVAMLPYHNSVGDPDDAAMKPYPCPVCGKCFKRISHVRRHQLLHTGDKPYQCDVCQERFSRLENRERHMAIHTKVHPYTCSVCAKGFTQLNRLKVHTLTHTGDRPFECQSCDKRFSRVDHLRLHQKTHGSQPEKGHGPLWNRVPLHGNQTVCDEQAAEDPEGAANQASQTSSQSVERDCNTNTFRCTQCRKSFSRRDHYNRHTLVHSDVKAYECDVCSRGFSRKDNKYSHMVNCMLRNLGILVEMGSGTLEQTIETKMSECRERMGDAAIGTSYLHLHGDAERRRMLEPLVALQVADEKAPCNNSRSSDADPIQSSPDSVGTIRLRAIKELSDNGMQCEEDAPDLSSTDCTTSSDQQHSVHNSVTDFDPDEDHDAYDDDDDDDEPLDPSAFLSAHISDGAEDYVDLNESTNAGANPTQQQQQRPFDASNSGAAQRFQCDLCERSFVHKSHLVRHSMVHTGTKPYSCDQCDKSFKRKEHLQRHVIVHTGIKPFKCALCIRSFYHLHQQVKHANDEHGEEAARLAAGGGDAMDPTWAFMDSGEPVQSADGQYHCDRCDKAYAIRFHLKRHYSRHTGDKPFQCEMCDQKFTRAEYKRRHMAIHTNDRRFECEFCDRRFMRADHMLKHIKTHEGVLPYKCNVCAHRFGTSKEKMEHARKHTGAYRCEMCLERFEAFADLAEHRRDIHLQNDTVKSEILVGRHEHYPCPICKQYFSIVALGDHLKSHVQSAAEETAECRESSGCGGDADQLEGGGQQFTTLVKQENLFESEDGGVAF